MTNKSTVIKSAITHLGDEKVVLFGSLYGLKVDTNKMSPMVLNAFINSDSGQMILKTIQTGTVIAMITVANLKNCIIPCPSLQDQFDFVDKYKIEDKLDFIMDKITNEHINLLRKLNVQIRICLDGDLPGQTAAMKAAKMLDQAGLDYMIVDNQGSTKDPDEILNEDGEEALRIYLNKLLIYHLSSLRYKLYYQKDRFQIYQQQLH